MATELVKEVALHSGVSQKQTEEVIKTLSDVIANQLSKGEEVSIPKLGKFFTKKVNAREGINPATKTKITIAEHTSPAFKFSKTLKDYIKHC